MYSTREIIARLLTNLGNAREVEQYLRLYSDVDANRFAVIRVGGSIIADQVAELASALTFLNHVGLAPIVIHGASEQLHQALATAGVEAPQFDGRRVFTAQVLEVARRVVHQVNLRLVEELELMGTRARSILSGVFDAAMLDAAQFGLTGEVTRVHLAPIESALRSGHLPVLSCLGETPGGQILYVPADVAASALAVALEPYKIIFLTPTGGLLDERHRIIPAINLTEDYEQLLAQPWVPSDMRQQLQEIKTLLDRLPDTSSVSITSPAHLARELFTYQGSGTLMRQGERVRCVQAFDQVDTVRLRHLLESCFGRRLTSDYFTVKACDRVYLSDSYRATAILTREGPIPYLDKFAVTQEAQGQGLGASLWGRMCREIPQLFWRSRVGNPVNPWYFMQSGGCYRSEHWVVFWYGLASYEVIRTCVERALALPATFLDPPAAMASA
jgi:acetylglutamate kinase